MSRYSEEDLKIYQGRVRGGVVGTREAKQVGRSPITNISAEEMPAGLARLAGSTNPAPSPYRSKLEAAWANYLDVLKAVKDIDGWAYESVNFRLPGQKNFYKIDFSSWVGREVIFFEVKGRNKSDDRSLVKMKTVAGLNPWARFVLVKRVKGVWEERWINGNK